MTQTSHFFGGVEILDQADSADINMGGNVLWTIVLKAIISLSGHLYGSWGLPVSFAGTWRISGSIPSSMPR